MENKELNDVEVTEEVTMDDSMESCEVEEGRNLAQDIAGGAILTAAAYGTYRFVKDTAVPGIVKGFNWCKNKFHEHSENRKKAREQKAKENSEPEKKTK